MEGLREALSMSKHIEGWILSIDNIFNNVFVRFDEEVAGWENE